MVRRSRAEPMTGLGTGTACIPRDAFAAGQVPGSTGRMWAQEEHDKVEVGEVGILL